MNNEKRTVATDDVLVCLRGGQHDEVICHDGERCVRVPVAVVDAAADEIERLRAIEQRAKELNPQGTISAYILTGERP